MQVSTGNSPTTVSSRITILRGNAESKFSLKFEAADPSCPVILNGLAIRQAEPLCSTGMGASTIDFIGADGGKGQWVKLLQNVAYEANTIGNGFEVTTSGLYTRFRASYVSGAIACKDDSNVLKSAHVWQQCIPSVVAKGFSFELKHNGDYLLEQPSEFELPPACIAPNTAAGEIYCNKEQWLEDGDILTPTWYGPSHGTPDAANATGKIYIDLWGFAHHQSQFDPKHGPVWDTLGCQDTVRVFETSTFGGWSATLEKGAYSIEDYVGLGAKSSANHGESCQSVEVPAGCMAVLYDGDLDGQWKLELEPGSYTATELNTLGQQQNPTWPHGFVGSYGTSSVKVVDQPSSLMQHSPVTRELGIHRPAFSSSVAENGVASRGNDGVTSSQFGDGSCMLTYDEQQPWWRVDLEDEYLVDHVVVHSRADGPPDQSEQLEVRVGSWTGRDQEARLYLYKEGVENLICGDQFHIVPGGSKRVVCNRPGRFVNVIRGAKGTMSLCEVQVFGTETNKGVAAGLMAKSLPISTGMARWEVTVSRGTNFLVGIAAAEWGGVGTAWPCKTWQGMTCVDSPGVNAAFLQSDSTDGEFVPSEGMTWNLRPTDKLFSAPNRFIVEVNTQKHELRILNQGEAVVQGQYPAHWTRLHPAVGRTVHSEVCTFEISGFTREQRTLPVQDALQLWLAADRITFENKEELSLIRWNDASMQNEMSLIDLTQRPSMDIQDGMPVVVFNGRTSAMPDVMLQSSDDQFSVGMVIEAQPRNVAHAVLDMDGGTGVGYRKPNIWLNQDNKWQFNDNIRSEAPATGDFQIVFAVCNGVDEQAILWVDGKISQGKQRFEIPAIGSYQLFNRKATQMFGGRVAEMVFWKEALSVQKIEKVAEYFTDKWLKGGQKDCVTNPWGAWGLCTKACGGGTASRSRTVASPATGGDECPELSQAQPCNTFACVDSCKVGEWEAWSTCESELGCGGGSQRRSRPVLQASTGGVPCPHLHENRECDTQDCPANCELSQWGSFSDCTHSCGGGMKTRSRSVIKEPLFGGLPCGMLRQSEVCNTGPCPRDCVPGAWGPWTACSERCEGGTQSRQRNVQAEAVHGGTQCSNMSQERACNQDIPCTVDCRLAEWTAWGSCSKQCGSGSQTRERVVETPAKGGGADCGHTHEERECSTKPCPTHCEMFEWAPWSDCTASCDGGVRTPPFSIDTTTEWWSHMPRSHRI
jgi:hypothetical protein